MFNARENLSKNIQKYRKQMNMSQKALADAVGAKSLTTVSSWERGANAPDIETICKLCEVFKIPVSELIGFAYFDSIADLDTLKKEISKIEVMEKYFESLGFSLKNNVTKWHWEDESKEVQIVDDVEYVLSKNGYSAVFTQEEFDEMQTGTKELIEGRFYKKVVQQHNQ